MTVDNGAARGRRYEMDSSEPAEAILASMKLNGMDRLWFVSGSEIGVFQEGSVKHRVLGRPTPAIMTMTHENAALAAACGDTIMTGKPSSAAFHVDVGLMNAGGAIHNADRGHHPVLMISGYPPSAEAGSVNGARTARIQWYQQHPDQGAIVREYMRWDHKLAPYDNAGLVVTRAAQVMLSEPRGPAFLSLPREAAMTPTEHASFPLIDQLQPARPPGMDTEAISEAAAWLTDAAVPVIVVSRLARDEQSLADVVALAELLGARVYADTHHGLAFPGTHPLLRGVPSMAPMPADADCVLVLDSLVPWMPTQFDPGVDVKLVRIAPDPVHRMTPIYEFPADLTVTANVSTAVAALLDEVRRRLSPERSREIAARTRDYEIEGRERQAALLERAERDSAEGSLNSMLVSREIGRLDPETIVVHELAEGGLFNRTQAGTLVGPGGSSIGFSAPMAVGMKAAAPDRQIVVAVGDGSWMFSNPQVTTWASAFHKAPVLFVIYNNRGYRTGTHEVLRAYPDGYAARNTDLTGGWFDPSPSYAAEAAASGYFGEQVTEPGELSAALERGLKANHEGVPAVVEVWLPKHITGET